MVVQVARAALPEPVGAWDFDEPQDLLKATVGRALGLTGQHLSIPGARAGDGAVRIGVGSHYVCDHGIAPQGGHAFVNRYSLLYDVRIPSIGPWYCLFQTHPNNGNDGDCFIRAGSGTVGVGQTGYSVRQVQAGVWQRLIVSADHTIGSYRIYLDGDLILQGSGQAVDGRFALESILLLFADEDGEDGVEDVTRVCVYDVCLGDAEAAALGGVLGDGSANQAPDMLQQPAGPGAVTTGQLVSYDFRAVDPESDLVQVEVDWGDGSGLSPWSGWVPSGAVLQQSHTYRGPGSWLIRALARDARGGLGVWSVIQTVVVTGPVVLEFKTLPFLQNVKTNGISIVWEMDGMDDEAAVDFGVDANYGQTVLATWQASGGGTQVYRGVLTGLASGTQYGYRCRAGGQEQRGVFVTAPAAAEDFVFSVWSDSQGPNHGAFVSDPLEPTKSMMRHMAASGVDLAVTSGDLAESGNSYADTRLYYLDRVAALLGRTVPWYVAWGNHDAGAASVIRRFGDLPSRERPGFTAGYGSYSFDYAGCHFVCIDHASAASDVMGWLEGDLQSEANRLAKFTFLFVHVPPFCELWIDGDDFLRGVLVPLMERYGVDACFSGHTHEYSRGYLNGVYYCITGGGSWLDFPEVLVHDWPHMTVGGQHAIAGVTKPGPERGGGLINEYVRVEVRGDTFTASMIGFRPDGSVVGVLDQFSKSFAPPSRPPRTPTLTGPAVVNVFAGGALNLRSSAFSDPDVGDVHLQSVWRLCRTADVEDGSGVLVEGVTGPGEVVWSLDVTNLIPGQTVYGSVKQVASDGQASLYGAPVAIRLLPEVVCREDFESVAEFSLPPGWSAEHRTTVMTNVLDPDNPLSNTYLSWTVVSRERLGSVFGANRVNVPVAVDGRSVYAESDHRSGVQLQYLTTPDMNLSGVTKVFLMFRSNYMQNQDSLGAVECSIDQGATWRSVVYLLDGPDVMTNADGTVDAGRTFTRVDDSGVPSGDGFRVTGGTYGEHVQTRPLEALGAYVSSRVNDDAVGSKRWERYRVMVADGKAGVRFRFTLVGTGSWFWGIDDFSLFGERVGEEALRITGIHLDGGSVELEWTGPVGPYQLQFRSSLGSGEWVDLGDEIPAGQRFLRVQAAGDVGFLRLVVPK